MLNPLDYSPLVFLEEPFLNIWMMPLWGSNSILLIRLELGNYALTELTILLWRKLLSGFTLF
jgi:hypothetical protein